MTGWYEFDFSRETSFYHCNSEFKAKGGLGRGYIMKTESYQAIKKYGEFQDILKIFIWFSHTPPHSFWLHAVHTPQIY